MPLIRCCVCNGRISVNAQICPKCGDPDPQYVQFLINKIIAALRECWCPVGQRNLDEAFDTDERTAFFHKVCELLTARSLSDMVTCRQNGSNQYIGTLIPFNLPKPIRKAVKTIALQHNYMIHALSRYFFDEADVTEQDVVQYRCRYFLRASIKAPYYCKGDLKDSDVNPYSELDDLLLDL